MLPTQLRIMRHSFALLGAVAVTLFSVPAAYAQFDTIDPLGPPPNIRPVAAGDTAETSFGQAILISVMLNDSDINGDAFNIQDYTQGGNGSVIQVGDSLQYTPNLGFSGDDTFTYYLIDIPANPTPEISNTATVTVTVGPNPAPVAGNDTASVAYEAAVSIDVLGNDHDPESGTLTIVNLVSGPKGATSVVSGEVRYVANAGETGQDTFTYRAQDVQGYKSDIATVTVTIGANPNRAPVAVDDSYAVAMGTVQTLAVLSDDSDPDGDNLTINQVNGQPISAGGSVTLGSGAEVRLNANGTLVYDTATVIDGTWEMGGTPSDPQPVWVPGRTSDSFDYRVSDGQASNTATVSITLTEDPPSTGPAPVAGNDTASVAYEAAVSIDVLGNDNDPEGGALTIVDLISGSKGVISVVGGEVRYVPNAGQTGQDTFTYRAQNAQGYKSDHATVTVTIGPNSNRAPIAANDSYSVAIGASQALAVLSGDSDPDEDNLTIDQVNGQSVSVGGTVSLGSGATVLLHSNGTLEYNAANVTGGSYVETSTPTEPEYTWEQGAPSDSFEYRITDGQATSTATVSITLTEYQPSTSPAPVAANDSYTVAYEASASLGVLDNDSDPQNDTLTIVGLTDGESGVTSVVSGQVLYVPNAGETGQDTFRYQVQNSQGYMSEVATVTVTISGMPNSPPVAANDSYTVAYETTASFDVLDNDFDSENSALTIVDVTAGTKGATSIVDGQVRYVPNVGQTGQDTFRYRVQDAQGLISNEATVTVMIGTDANRSPIAADDHAYTKFQATIDINVLANDHNPVGGQLMIVDLASGSKGMTSVANGRVRYVPGAGQTGIDSFTYRAENDQGYQSDEATVIVDIGGPENAAPVAGDTNVDLTGLAQIEVNLYDLVSDADGDPLTLSIRGFPSFGTVSQVSGGIVTYTPSAAYRNQDSFVYSVSDGSADRIGMINVMGVPIGGGGTIGDTPEADVSYEYDALGRLQLAAYSAGSADYLAWCYDEGGNRIEVDSGLGDWSAADCPLSSPSSASQTKQVNADAQTDGGGSESSPTLVIFDDAFQNGASAWASTSSTVTEQSGYIEVVSGPWNQAGMTTGTVVVDSSKSVLRFRIKRVDASNDTSLMLRHDGWTTATLNADVSSHVRIDGVAGRSFATDVLDSNWHTVEVDLVALGIGSVDALSIRGDTNGNDRVQFDDVVFTDSVGGGSSSGDGTEASTDDTGSTGSDTDTTTGSSTGDGSESSPTLVIFDDAFQNGASAWASSSSTVAEQSGYIEVVSGPWNQAGVITGTVVVDSSKSVLRFRIKRVDASNETSLMLRHDGWTTATLNADVSSHVRIDGVVGRSFATDVLDSNWHTVEVDLVALGIGSVDALSIRGDANGNDRVQFDDVVFTDAVGGGSSSGDDTGASTDDTGSTGSDTDTTTGSSTGGGSESSPTLVIFNDTFQNGASAWASSSSTVAEQSGYIEVVSGPWNQAGMTTGTVVVDSSKSVLRFRIKRVDASNDTSLMLRHDGWTATVLNADVSSHVRIDGVAGRSFASDVIDSTWHTVEVDLVALGIGSVDALSIRGDTNGNDRVQLDDVVFTDAVGGEGENE